MSTPADNNPYRVTEADIRQWVRSHVWRGEFDTTEIPMLIVDSLGVGDKVDEDWLQEVIDAEVATKREAEKSWPAVTDFDRLDRTFRSLRQQGIIALHLAGFTQSDGLEEVEDDYHDLDDQTTYAGHCFYTEQDQERAARQTGGMCIGFGHLSGDDTKGVAVGHCLRAALEREGFSVEWDGTIGRRLFVKDFHWQRRGP